jgi:hypothetical protein
MPRSLVLLALLAGACDADPTPAADAASPDGEVAAPDAAVPPDAAEPIVVGGTVFDVTAYQVTPLAGAAVELHSRSDGAVLGAATADAEGRFAITVAGDGPVDGVVTVAAADHLPTRAYPAAPLAGGEDLLLLAVGGDELAAWYVDAGDVHDPGDRTVLAAAVDSAGDPIPDATLTVAPAPAALVYYDDEAQRWDPALTAAGNGFALATGAAAAVTLTWAGLPPREVSALPDELTIAVVSP